MKKVVLPLVILTSLLASCGQQTTTPQANQGTSSTLEANPINILGGAIFESEFSKHPELTEKGWNVVAPGIALRQPSSGGYETVINYDIITKDSVEKLKTLASSKDNKAAIEALNQIQATLNQYANGDIVKFKQQMSPGPIRPQNSADIGWYYSNLYGCTGSLTAGPLDPGDGAKAYVKYECKGQYQAVAEMYAAAGYDNTVNYKAVQGRLNYQIVSKTGNSYCQSKALLAIVVPGSSTITGGVNVGGEIMKTVNGQASFSSSVTYNQPAKIVYSVGWPDSTGSGC